MHFRAEMTVRLDSPMTILGSDSSEESTGYIIVIGVNAQDIAAATKFAQEVALRPKQADGTFRSFQGKVTEANVRQIEKSDWAPTIQQNAKKIDQEGVYYSTGLIFFGEGK